MTQTITRRAFTAGVGAAVGTGALTALVGCGNGANGGASTSAESQATSTGTSASAPAAGAGSTGSSSAGTLVVGSLSTEDILPLWVAEDAGLYGDAAGVTASVAPFQSAAELIAGMSSGELDLAMTDIMVTASLFAGGIDVKMGWVTLGTEPDQGRFGIMVGPDSNIQSLTDLAGVPIGVGTNTILEYVMDGLMSAAGVPDDQIVVEEIQKLPMRYQAMVSGEVAAAALPGSLLALGEAQGCRLIADDTQGENLSQSVMISRADVIARDGKQGLVTALAGVWDQAVDLINADPERYRDVLVRGANLPDAVAETYPICTYPHATLPTSAMVDPVLAWMEKKGYLARPLTYNETTGEFSFA